MPAYYNEFDKSAAAWLRELIKAGLIAYGDVDERSIEDVLPSDLRGYTQCHFFAGIGVWSHALRQSGWDDDRPVWTGSCPCQPFSAAGKGIAFADERHLWPAFHHLIKECRPPVVFGEQVASKDADAWIDLVQTDLEAVGYALGAVPFPSAGVGAPHIRDRLYWVADADNARLEGRGGMQERSAECIAWPRGVDCRLGNADSDGAGRERAGIHQQEAGEGRRGCGDDAGAPGATDRPGPTNGFWRDADWLGCRDGKFRPVEPGTFPLVAGASARVVRLRGYGNAINAEAAKAFITSFIEATGQSTRKPSC